MRYHHRNEGIAWTGFMIVLGLCVAALLIVGIYKYIQVRAKCTDNGGEWVKYNCRQVTTTTWDYDEQGMMTGWHTETYERCDEKCVGASAEAQP